MKKEKIKEEKINYVDVEPLLKYKAHYNILIGERSNGKTTAVLRYALKRYVESGYIEQLAIIRRYEDDFKGKNGKDMFSAFISNNRISEFTNNEYQLIIYYAQEWFLAKIEKNKEGKEEIKKMSTPFAKGFALTREEHYKSMSYPNIKTILFDEFITRGYYLPDEFLSFTSILSTIIRLRTDVKIFMCANTINKYNPYIKEMGLYKVENQAQDTIDLYNYGDTDLKVLVFYTGFNKKHKKSNVYFAFNNPKLKMITEGGWEIDIYPHLPKKFKPKDVWFSYYIDFENHYFKCLVIRLDNNIFTYITRKTTPIIEKTYPVYSKIIKPDFNYCYNIYAPRNNIERFILSQFRDKKIFYQDNEVGEIIRNFLIQDVGE